MPRKKQYQLSDIIPNPNNPRLIQDDKLDKLIGSIKDFPKMMALRPIILDENNVILGGNMRFKALKKLGYKEVPAEWIKKAADLSEEEKRQFIIKDNVGFGEWDWILLANEWDEDELEEWGLEVEFEEPDKEVEAEEDNYQIPDEIHTDIVLGDLIEIGRHRLLCGDSTNSDDVERLMCGENELSIYTDPPYGINLNGDNSKRGSKTSLMQGGLNLKSFKDDSIQYAVDAYSLMRAYNPKKEVWWGANYYCHHLPQSNNWLVWDKRVEEKMRNTNSDCELAWVKDGHNSVRIFRHLWNGLIKASEKGEKRVHPTQKPIELAVYCFNSYEMGDCIIDLFGGSGSTMVACQKTNRKCIMMEFEPHYCQVIIDRMMKLDPAIEVKINGKPYVREEESIKA